MSSWYRSHQFIEVEVVQLHDLSLVPQRGDLLVLVELYDGESWAWEGELNGVAPNLALVGNTRLGVVLWNNIRFTYSVIHHLRYAFDRSMLVLQKYKIILCEPLTVS